MYDVKPGKTPTKLPEDSIVWTIFVDATEGSYH